VAEGSSSRSPTELGGSALCPTDARGSTRFQRIPSSALVVIPTMRRRMHSFRNSALPREISTGLGDQGRRFESSLPELQPIVAKTVDFRAVIRWTGRSGSRIRARQHVSSREVAVKLLNSGVFRPVEQRLGYGVGRRFNPVLGLHLMVLAKEGDNRPRRADTS
jgi:hypothetical protein